MMYWGCIIGFLAFNWNDAFKRKKEKKKKEKKRKEKKRKTELKKEKNENQYGYFSGEKALSEKKEESGPQKGVQEIWTRKIRQSIPFIKRQEWKASIERES